MSLAPITITTSVFGKVFVEFVHFHHDVVRHLGFSQQHVHVAGHASRHRVDAKTDVDTPSRAGNLVIS
jgi:hypothetical protein